MGDSVWAGKTVLVTGGTGSFGRKFTEIVLRERIPRRLIVFSRDEVKQDDMRHAHTDVGGSPMRYFIGDVRDADRLHRACRGVDIVVHAAALKQVPACEYNPFEAVKTNVVGAKNVIDAALDNGVSRILAVSTDKAVNPVNLYGATKLVAEKLFVQGNAYTGDRPSLFSCVRYGNVVGSRGSVVPLFLEQRRSGSLTVTDPRMTRFWITLDQGVRFVLRCLDTMRGGEIFVPKIPSMRIGDVAKTIAPDCRQEVTGLRSGEKLHEVLVSSDEARHAVECDGMYVIYPDNPWVRDQHLAQDGHPLAEEFRYSSDANTQWLTSKTFSSLVAETK